MFKMIFGFAVGALFVVFFSEIGEVHPEYIWDIKHAINGFTFSLGLIFLGWCIRDEFMK